MMETAAQAKVSPEAASLEGQEQDNVGLVLACFSTLPAEMK